MASITFWGLVASPYQLKMQSIADFAELSWRRQPEQGSLIANLRLLRRVQKARAGGAVQRFPSRVEGMDEYPAVPYYTLDGSHYYYDSTGLARHLDSLGHSAPPLIPESSAEQFLCCLIDEAFDEFGLYMVHHNRWVTSASTNVMGEMTVREMIPGLLPPLRRVVGRRLARRQSRRCPYLFSIAPPDFESGVDPDITPPSRAGFPPTHALLDEAWRSYLAAMEQRLAEQPFLLGKRFTLADASAYGQLGMNLVDGRAADLLRELAPLTYDWLCAIRDGKHQGSRGQLQLDASLGRLITCIGDTFIPLMRQNTEAWARHSAQGQRRFNEAAFNRGEALYDGELLGKPFRAVAKSFQVVVWEDLLASWSSLESPVQEELLRRYPSLLGVNDAPVQSAAPHTCAAG